jgi:GR25 family glycosyltransferase involved in LPS biosynthesis
MQNFKAYCLTLKETPERTQRAKERFDLLGMNVEFFIAEKHKNGGRYGCWDSHIKIWELANSKKENIVIVFEDDIIINESLETINNIYKEAIEAFNKDKNLCVVNLSSTGWYSNNFITNKIMYAPSLGLYGYIINVNNIFNIKSKENLLPDGKHVDAQLLINNKSKIYIKNASIYPRLNVFHEKGNITNNDYGIIGNFLTKILGYDNIWDSYLILTKYGKNFKILNLITLKTLLILNKII